LVKSLPARLARRIVFRPERFVPFAFRGSRIGWLRPELAARLGAWPKVFKATAEQVKLIDAGALAPVVTQLAQEGFIPGWRDERYRIADSFDIERAGARPFGLATQAVHVNGVVDDEAMWIARRSSTKATDPGMLDNLVGGGLTAGLSTEEVLVKEAWEEAGLPAELARRAARAGTVELLREVPEGVQCETIHVYDLALPRDFAPQNQDGEVAEHRLAPLTEVRRLVEETEELTVDAALVALDFLSRRSARHASAPAGADRAT
jgi:8-oxo-dGTP pyrophosphatase MutT (NUDIX family)